MNIIFTRILIQTLEVKKIAELISEFAEISRIRQRPNKIFLKVIIRGQNRA